MAAACSPQRPHVAVRGVLIAGMGLGPRMVGPAWSPACKSSVGAYTTRSSSATRAGCPRVLCRPCRTGMLAPGRLPAQSNAVGLPLVAVRTGPRAPVRQPNAPFPYGSLDSSSAMRALFHARIAMLASTTLPPLHPAHAPAPGYPSIPYHVLIPYHICMYANPHVFMT